jgi:hypothetical protein
MPLAEERQALQVVVHNQGSLFCPAHLGWVFSPAFPLILFFTYTRPLTATDCIRNFIQSANSLPEARADLTKRHPKMNPPRKNFFRYKK